MRDNEKGVPVAEQGALWNKQVKMILVAPEIRLCHSFQEHWAQLADWPAHLYKVLISYAPSFLELDWLSSKPWESFVFPLLELGLQTLTIIPGFYLGTGNANQLLMLVWQALHQLNRLTSLGC